MTLLNLILILLGLGAIAFLIDQAPMIKEPIKAILCFVLVVVAVFVVGQFFGVWSAVAGIRLNHG